MAVGERSMLKRVWDFLFLMPFHRAFLTVVFFFFFKANSHLLEATEGKERHRTP